MTLTPAGMDQHALTATITGGGYHGNQNRSIANAATLDVSSFNASPQSNPVPKPGDGGLAVTFVGLNSTVHLTSYAGEDGDQIESALRRAAQAELASLAKYGDLADAAGSVRAAVMWNAVFCPAEQGPSRVHEDQETPSHRESASGGGTKQAMQQ